MKMIRAAVKKDAFQTRSNNTSKQHEHYIKIKCKTKARGRKQSKLKKREGKLEEKKNEQKLKGDIAK